MQKLNQSPNNLVYLVKEQDSNLFKIGFTNNLKRRLITLQCGNPRQLEVIHTFDGNRNDESELQLIFDDYRIKNEWFQLPDHALDFIGGL